MTTITFDQSPYGRFDVVEFIQKLRKANFSQEQSEVLAQETERLLEATISAAKDEVRSKDAATKGDVRESELRLQKEIEVVRRDIKAAEIKLMTLYGIGFLSLLGIIAKGFHWW